LWDDVRDRLAPGENVRVALQFVARGECPLGVVYGSDASVEPGVRVVARFPDESHDPITYVAALTKHANGRQAPARVLAWLQTSTARQLLERNGFIASPRP
jgi:molybdate transport system substrate-binding protein